MFKKIYIEITNRCNLACSFCQPSSRTPAFMRPGDFAEILKRISGHTNHISLHVLGEALLHPELALVLAMSRDYGLRVNLATNGVLLAQNQAMLLRQPALRQVNISLHSFEKSGDEAALDGYLTGIFSFISAAAVSSSPLFINLRIWDRNQAIETGGSDLSGLIRKRLANHFKTATPIPADFGGGRGLTLAPQVFLSQENLFVWPHVPGPELGPNGYCRGLRDHLAILVDGTVVPCCLDAEADMPLGNIFEKSLAEILAGPRATMIRAGFASQRLVEPVCRRCNYRLRFQRNNVVLSQSAVRRIPVAVSTVGL